MEKIIIKVMGMECEGCENRIKNVLKNVVDGEVLVDYKKGTVTINSEDKIDTNLIEEKITNLGFDIEKD